MNYGGRTPAETSALLGIVDVEAIRTLEDEARIAGVRVLLDSSGKCARAGGHVREQQSSPFQSEMYTFCPEYLLLFASDYARSERSLFGTIAPEEIAPAANEYRARVVLYPCAVEALRGVSRQALGVHGKQG